jgi:hypothetical protein
MSLPRLATVFISASSLILSSCGTLTGIPSHGGGKRFATEQKLVSASIRNTLRAIDVSPLRGHKVALIFDLISDEGAGNLSGGRLSLGGVIKAASVISPVTSTASQFQVFDLVNGNTNFQNVSSGSSGSSTATTTNIVTTGTTSTSSGTDSSTSNGSGTINNPETTTTTTTGATVTTQVTGANTTTTSDTSTTNGTSSGTGTSNSTSNGTSNNNTNTTNNTTSGSTGGYTTNRQEISPAAVASQQQREGNDLSAGVNLVYKGMGNYSNLSVPKSDASLLMGLVRNYLLLNGVRVTVPTDPQATAIVYITVDVFGIVRSRFDAYAYNKETVRAETAIEMMAFDKRGKMIMRPCSANEEAEYNERYILWAGPFITDKRTKKGEGLLVDFKDITPYQRPQPIDVRTERNVVQFP